MCQTSSSVEWYRNKFVGGKTGRLCHSCYCRERATALDVRCAQCQNERTSGNWAIPKNKGKFKHGDRLCNACYRRELVSLKVEARGEEEKLRRAKEEEEDRICIRVDDLFIYCTNIYYLMLMMLPM